MAKNKKNSNTLLSGLVIVAILLFMFSFFLGYSYKDKIFSFLGSSEQLSVDNPDDSETREEESNISRKDVPEGFPKDFPIYIDSRVEDSWTASGNSTKGISIIWETQDSVDEVYEFYKSNLSKTNWKIVEEYKKEDSEIITFEKDNASGFVGITKGESGTMISVTMGIGS
jgi:hypothetical protein